MEGAEVQQLMAVVAATVVADRSALSFTRRLPRFQFLEILLSPGLVDTGARERLADKEGLEALEEREAGPTQESWALEATAAEAVKAPMVLPAAAAGVAPRLVSSMSRAQRPL